MESGSHIAKSDSWTSGKVIGLITGHLWFSFEMPAHDIDGEQIPKIPVQTGPCFQRLRGQHWKGQAI